MAQLCSLPLEVLLLITHYLGAGDLLSLCSTCQALQYNSELRQSQAFWSSLTRSTFRIPHYPLADSRGGAEWMKLYQRLSVSSRIYVWGNNDKGCFGHEAPTNLELDRQPRRHGAGRSVPRNLHMPPRYIYIPWPSQMPMENVGIIADLQCGGWSTTVLNSRGELYTTGVLDGMRPGAQSTRVKLQFPSITTGISTSAFDSTHNRVASLTAIRQFSSGRCHILGLSDSGRIWAWDHAELPGLHVKFLGVDLAEQDCLHTTNNHTGRVTKVVAGWNKSSAYVKGHGIIIWDSAGGDGPPRRSDYMDTTLVLEHWTVPHSGYINKSRNRRLSLPHDPTDAAFGQVVNWALLENHVVFVTDLGKLFAVHSPTYDTPMGETFRVSSITESVTADLPEASCAADVQGAYRTFAMFQRDGAVLLGEERLLDALNARASSPNPVRATLPQLRRIPALQNSGVLAMAFGDHHFHALHTNGSVSSYGSDNHGRGSLGVLRGQSGEDFGGYPLHAEGEVFGRRVAFEPEKSLWLQHLRQDPGWAEWRNEAVSRDGRRLEITEWVEQQSRKWEDGPLRGTSRTAMQRHEESANSNALPAYFALSVAAGGWHSGALVLMDEAKAERVRECWRATAADMPHEQKLEDSRPTNPDMHSDARASHVLQDPALGTGTLTSVAEPAASLSAPAPSTVAAPAGMLDRALDVVQTAGRRFLGLPTSDAGRQVDLAVRPTATDTDGTGVVRQWYWEVKSMCPHPPPSRPALQGLPAWRSVEYVDV